MMYVDITTSSEESQELLISGLQLFLWDARMGLVQRGVNRFAGTKILRIKVQDEYYAEMLAFRIAHDLVETYSCFVHRPPDLWVPDTDSPFGYEEFRLQPFLGSNTPH